MAAPGLDLPGTSAALRRRVTAAQAQLADGFAQLVRSSPDERLERVLSTPLRRAALDAIFWQMPRHFNGTNASGMSATIRWRITAPGKEAAEEHADVYEVEIDGGRCRVRRGRSDTEPRVTITLDALEFVRLATGNSDPMQAYFRGRIRLDGDIMVAARMQSAFRIPGKRMAPHPVRTVSESR